MVITVHGRNMPTLTDFYGAQTPIFHKGPDHLNVATIAKYGLLIVRREQSLVSSRECIIVPQQVLDGLLMAATSQI